MFRNWVRATWLGWVLGLVLMIAAALGAEAVGAGGSQTPVGLGMGLGVGVLQARCLRAILPEPWMWLISTVASLCAPFAVWDVLRAVGFELPYSLYAAVALGGLLVGCWQAHLLRGVVGRPGT